MFATTKAFSGFAVDDLGRAETFYSETLGLKTTISSFRPTNPLLSSSGTALDSGPT